MPKKSQCADDSARYSRELALINTGLQAGEPAGDVKSRLNGLP